MRALRWTWPGRRKGETPPPAMLLASRDLPDSALALPRSPEPLSEAQLAFARRAAARPARVEAAAEPAIVPSIATGADLRALLDTIQREALEQAADARAALDLAGFPADQPQPGQGDDSDAALAAALETLRRMTRQGLRQAR